VVLPSLLRLWPEILQDLLQPENTDRSSTDRFFRRWTFNFFGKILEKNTLPLIRSLHSEHHGCLFCGAGPGLLDDLKPIQKNLHKMLIISSDTALAPLLANQIVPDLILSIDAGRGTEYHFSAAQKLKKIPFPSSIPVLSWLPGPSVLDDFFSDIIYYPSSFPFDQVLCEYAKLDFWENPSRNLAGLALILAGLAGFASLYTAGADFKAKNQQSHIRGSGYTYYALQRVNRTCSLEMYRPGGYSDRLTQKNKTALEGLMDLSVKLGIKVLPLSEGHAPKLKETLTEPKIQITAEKIKQKELIQFFLKHWNHFPFSMMGMEFGGKFFQLKNKIRALLESSAQEN